MTTSELFPSTPLQRCIHANNYIKHRSLAAWARRSRQSGNQQKKPAKTPTMASAGVESSSEDARSPKNVKINGGLSNAAIQDVAHQAGMRRLSRFIHGHARANIYEFLDEVVRVAVIYAEERGRKTVTEEDMTSAMESVGMHMYGMGAVGAPQKKATRAKASKEE